MTKEAIDITFDKILKWFQSPEKDYIYGYMYGAPYVKTSSGKYEKEKIIRISKSSLQLGRRNDCFVYVWGFPGPDYNIYSFLDYGVTWAFSKEEIIQMSAAEWEFWRLNGICTIKPAPRFENGGWPDSAYKKWLDEHFDEMIPKTWKRLMEVLKEDGRDSGASEGVGREDRAGGDVQGCLE